MGECRQQKRTQHAPSTKMECDYLNGWTKKTVTYAKISPKSGEPQRYSWGTHKKKKKKKKKRWEYNQGLVFAHMLSIARTQKTLTFMFQTGEYRQQKHTQHAPSMKMECDYLYAWIKKKKRSHTQKSHQIWWTPEIQQGTQKKKKKKKKMMTPLSWSQEQGMLISLLAATCCQFNNKLWSLARTLQ